MRDFVDIRIPMDALIAAVAANGIGTRIHDMVDKHGEVCSKAKAEKLLHCGAEKLDEYIRMGKIRTACEGVFIDVRSIAEFMERGTPGRRV